MAELLRLNHLSPVYHGGHGLRSLKELVRSYLTITEYLGEKPIFAIASGLQIFYSMVFCEGVTYPSKSNETCAT